MFTELFIAILLLSISIYQWKKPSSEMSKLPESSFLALMYSFFKGDTQKIRFKRIMNGQAEKFPVWRAFMFGDWGLYILDADYVADVSKDLELFPKIVHIEEQPYSPVSQYFGYNTVTTNGEDWRKHKKITSPAFPSVLNTNIFGECSKDFLKIYLGSKTQTVDVANACQCFTLDVMGKTAFDYDFKSMSGEQSKLVQSYNRVVGESVSTFNLLFPFISRLWFLPHVRQFNNDLRDFNSFLLEMISSAKAKFEKDKEKIPSNWTEMILKANQSNILSDSEVMVSIINM